MLNKKVILICSLCLSRNYHYKRSKFATDRLELNKYCASCRKKTLHKESK